MKKNINTYEALKPLGSDLIFLMVLILVAIKVNLSIERIKDIGLYDESIYLHWGVQWMKYSVLPPEMKGFLYSFWYGVLSLMQRDTVTLYYLNYRILVVTTMAALYICLRSIKVIPLIAGIASYIYLVSRIPIVWPHITLFLLLLFLFSISVAARVKSNEVFYSVIGGSFLLAAYIRPEQILSFLLLYLFILGNFFKKIKNNSFFWTHALTLTGLSLWAVVAVSQTGSPIELSKNGFVFFQHFSVNFVAWTGSSLNPWTNYSEITQSVFGNAKSIPEALFNNPPFFFKHLFFNMLRYPQVLTSLFEFTTSPNLVLKGMRVILKIFFLMIFVQAIFLFVKKLKTGEYSLRSAVAEKWIVLCVCCLVPTIITAIVIYPRNHYLVLQCAGIIIFCAWKLSNEAAKLAFMRDTKVLILVSFIFLLLTPCRAGVGWRSVLPQKPLEYKPLLYNQIVIDQIRSIGIQQPVRMLEADGGFNIYVGDNYARVAEYDKKEPFNSFMKNYDINMVLVDKLLQTDTRFANDPEFDHFINHFELGGFIKHEIPGMAGYLLIKNELLKGETKLPKRP